MDTTDTHAPGWVARLRTFYQRAYTFATRDVWLLDTTPSRSFYGLVVRQVQIILIVVRGFFVDHQCLLRASALTYTTLLALVPMLAFMFAFLKGLGVQNQLEPLLLEKLAVGPESEEVIRRIIDYINNVKVGTLGAIGLGSLLFSTILQLSTVEKSLNEIWGVTEGRPLVRKIADYVSVMVIAPVLLLLALATTAALKNQALVVALLHTRFIGDAFILVFTLLPYVAVWGVFTFFYAFMPNTRVRLLPAFVGGLFGGTLWQLAQWGYIAFQVGLSKYQAIYGAFAQLPVLMIWLYISWVIVLLGAEVAFACQNAATYAFERLVTATSYHVREWLACAVYFSMARDFTAGRGPWSAMAFARRHRLPVRLMREVLQTLLQEKLVVEDAALPEHYVPARDPDRVTPWNILSALRHHGKHDLEETLVGREPGATALIRQVEAAAQQVAGARSVVQWLAESAPAQPAPPEPLPLEESAP